MEMPKGASSENKEKVSAEGLFDSVMTPMPALPKLGDDLKESSEGTSIA